MRPLKLSDFLARQRALIRPGALPKVLGDAILLDCSPLFRNLRTRVKALGGRFEARATPSSGTLEPPRRDRIEFIPNLVPWLSQLRDVDARSIVRLLPRNFVVRDSAVWIARAILANSLDRSAALLVAEAFSEGAQVLSGLFSHGEEARAIAYQLNCPPFDTLSVQAQFRIVEFHLGTKVAIRSVVAIFASSLSRRPVKTRAGARALLRAIGAPSNTMGQRCADVLVTLVEQLKPTRIQHDQFTLRRIAAGVTKLPDAINFAAPSTTLDAVIAVADALTP